MKKITTLLLALALCGSLAACDAKDADDGQSTAPDKSGEDTVLGTMTPAEPDAAQPSDGAPTDQPQQDAPQTEDKPSGGASAPAGGSASAGGTAKPSQPAPESKPQPAPSPTPEDKPAPSPAPEPAKPTLSQAAGYVGSSASSLEAALGAPNAKSYSPSCMGEGEDGIWSYDGFTVYTYRENGAESVEAVQ